MTHYDDIEKFKGGGRISPERSATDFPKGTLGVGENGNVWINQPDKNGRLSWKATHITKDYRVVSFGYWDDETIDFKIMVSGYEFFLLRYAYNQDSYIRFSYPNDGNEYEKEANLQVLLDFFNDKFSASKFDLSNTDPNYKGNIIKQQVELLLRRLMLLKNNQGLRSPEPKFEVGQTVQIKGRFEKYVITEVTSKDDDGIQLYEGRYTETGDLFTLIENTLELATDKTKFKRGDKVKLPTTKNGQKLVGGMSNVWDDAKKSGQEFLVVCEVWDNTISLDTELSKYGDYFSQELDKLELYEEMPKNQFDIYWNDYDTVNKTPIGQYQQQTVLKSLLKPDYDVSSAENFKASWEKLNNDRDAKIKKVITRITWTDDKDYFFNLEDSKTGTPFEQIDFLKPSTEELDILIKGMQNYSDGLTFENSRTAIVKIKNKLGEDFKVVAFFDKDLGSIVLAEPITESKVRLYRIYNESLSEITEMYVNLLTELIQKIEAETPKDCEADPNKIISGQVKKFYDLNKTRIDKLDSKFSCKIVQALVSLSEYESCGSPSSSILPKAKSDLLSRISKLKV